MTAISTKPVKQCYKCVLNLKKQCAIFEYPILKWHHRQCEGYNNPVLIAQYRKMKHPEGARARKVERTERAKIAHTLTHSDGVHRSGGVR